MSTPTSALHAQLRHGLDAVQGNAALCVMSLDNLGRIAGEFGIAASEHATREFDDRVSSMMRSQDHKLSMAPDRICVVFDQLTDPNHTLLVALKFERLFEEPLCFEDAAIKLMPRAGLVYCPLATARDDDAVDDLYQHAETARELAVEQDACFAIADPSAVRQAVDHWNLDAAVEDALANHDLELSLHPQLGLDDLQTRSYEAVLRWRRGDRWLTPDAFLPTLSPGRIREVGEYAVRGAMQAVRDLGGDVTVAIDVDNRVLNDSSFLSFLDRETAIWQVDPQRLCFEVSETDAFTDVERTATALRSLRTSGYQIAIDHFGAGLSSLARFPDLPADQVKIDRQLVAQLDDQAANQHIIQTIVDLAHRFDRVVIADGVDDGDTANVLTALGCDLGQGSHLGEPIKRSPVPPN